jgi:ribonuclease HI
MEKYILVFDGGSRGNPGRSFGSFRIQPGKSKPKAPVRLDLGHGTNNEAEYRALIAGLQATVALVEQQDLDPAEVHIEIRGDSQLVLNQLSGAWKTKNPRMRSLRDQAAALLVRFGSSNLVHQSRSRTVEILGH